VRAAGPSVVPSKPPCSEGSKALAIAIPITATMRSPAVSEIALFTPDATPECSRATELITVVVSGATVSYMPKPSTTKAGKKPVQYVESIPASVLLCDADGRLVICGGHSGEVVPFDIIPFFRAQKQVIGSFVYDRWEIEKVLDLAARGLIEPLVYKVFPLGEAREAMEVMERREHFGKIVLKP